jgi:hypothetical protein
MEFCLVLNKEHFDLSRRKKPNATRWQQQGGFAEQREIDIHRCKVITTPAQLHTTRIHRPSSRSSMQYFILYLKTAYYHMSGTRLRTKGLNQRRMVTQTWAYQPKNTEGLGKKRKYKLEKNILEIHRNVNY